MVEVDVHSKMLVYTVKRIIQEKLQKEDVHFVGLSKLTIKDYQDLDMIPADKIALQGVFKAKLEMGVSIQIPMEVKFEDSSVVFEWKEPSRFVTSLGSNWEYQPDPYWSEMIRSEIELHYDNWKQGVFGRTSHLLFLCSGAPGSGKSRLLDEFPRLVKESVRGIAGLEIVLKNAYCFNLSFGNETAKVVRPFQASLSLGTRMMYQLQDEKKWSTFMKEHRVTIGEAIYHLSKLQKQQTSDMCVILCIDAINCRTYSKELELQSSIMRFPLSAERSIRQDKLLSLQYVRLQSTMHTVMPYGALLNADFTCFPQLSNPN
jgi:hypothetical protein